MNLNPLRRAGRAAIALGALLTAAVSCINIDKELGGNFIPTDQIWNVFPCEPVVLEDITLSYSDSLSGYSTSRFTFGSVMGDEFTGGRVTSFTLVPLVDSLDFGEDTEVLQFHFTASRDTLSFLYDAQERMLQNVYVHPLKAPLDSTILYTNSLSTAENLEKYVDLQKRITNGTPIYNGGDSLSFDFSKEYAWEVIEGVKAFQGLPKEDRDSLGNYLKKVPGIYIRTDVQTEKGGRINMFNLPMQASDGYIDANYAELKIRAKYDGRQTDTLFVFYFGPSEFIQEGATSYPAQYAFNGSTSSSNETSFLTDWQANPIKEKIYIEGGNGVKPIVKAEEIKRLVNELIEQKAADTEGGLNPEEVVVNKATIMLPYNVGTDYALLDRYPMILSPTVKLTSNDGKYVSYAGLTDSSIESENQGDINRSLCMYCPDISHHVQEIVKLKQGVGEDVDPGETDEQFSKRLAKYDIWFLIMHEEVKKSSTSSSNDDYYNSLLYNSYYNNMMYDPYGYGYGYGGYGGYGYGGYGYGGYGGYGYDNYYNYYMMAAYANAANSSSSQEATSIELDKDRFYNAVLNGPDAGGDDISQKPRLKITFSAPKKAE